MTTAGIILAAGASSRMGSPKALLDYRGETFVGRLIRVFSEVCDPVIVVLGYHADAIQPQIEELSLALRKPHIVINREPERGQLSSLQEALRALPAQSEGFLFSPVDSPAVSAETVRLIASAFENRDSDTQIVVPCFEGHHGHPVCASRLIGDEMLALPATTSARHVIHDHVARTRYLDVNDSGILIDVDDPQAYRTLDKQAKEERTKEKRAN